MAVDSEVFKQSVETASIYVHFVAQGLENAGLIQSPYDKTSAEKVVEMILKKMSYTGNKTAIEFVNEIISTFQNIDTREQLVSIIVTCRPIVNIINNDLDDSCKEMA